MCGFAGFLTFGGSSPDQVESRRGVLAAMGRSIAHRGPDDEQFYDDGHLALVFRRLSIVDLGGGQQPIFNETGTRLIVVNGEIYNHRALRGQLQDRHVFRTGSDSEVPLHLHEDFGADALQRLNGMFALAIWDRPSRSLFLARDRLGIKPLYVCRLADGLLFGSEIHALLAHPQCPRELDWTALDLPGAHQEFPVASYVRGIEHLPGGHYLTAADGRTDTRCYWRIDDHLGTARFGDNAADYRREYRDLLHAATIEHLLSDVPIGLHLSGGVDSSLIAAIVATQRRDLSCFSVIERTSVQAGDAANVRSVTAALGLPCHPVLFDYRNLLDQISFDLTRFEQAVYMMGSPRFEPEWLLKEELHRFARATHPALKVVLLGQGADEFAGGYSNRIDRPCRGWADYLDREVVPDLRHWQARDAVVPERLRGLTRCAATAPRGNVGPYHAKMARMVPQLQHYNLWHEDRSSMFQSLEARVPFLDHRLVELLASVPASLHAELFWDKQIVRATLHEFMPGYDITHPKIPFVATDDSRSIDILINQIVLRTFPAFIDKYASLAGFPFDEQLLRETFALVTRRSAGFSANCSLLIECMAVAIFKQHCEHPPEHAFRAQRERTAGPPAVAPDDWVAIERAFAADPVAPPMDWRLGDRVRLTEGAAVVQTLATDAVLEYLLVERNGICSTISVPRKHPWLANFLRNLDAASTSEFTVDDWLDEFEIDLHEFREILGLLYQCGFVHKSVLAAVATEPG